MLATKYYIYKCKMEGCNIQNYLKHMYNIEKLALNIRDKSRHEAEWRDFKNLFISLIIIGALIYLFMYLCMYLFFLLLYFC